MFYARVAKKERERPIRKLVYVKYHMFTIHVHACIRGNGVANGALGSWDFPKRFPRIAFSRRAARSDSSLVFRRDFIVEKSAFKRGRLQVATASRTRSPDGTRVHVYVCVRVYASATRHFAIIFIFFFLLSGWKEKTEFALEYHLIALATIHEKKSHTAKKSKSAIRRDTSASLRKHRVEMVVKGE